MPGLPRVRPTGPTALCSWHRLVLFQSLNMFGWLASLGITAMLCPERSTDHGHSAVKAHAGANLFSLFCLIQDLFAPHVSSWQANWDSSQKYTKALSMIQTVSLQVMLFRQIRQLQQVDGCTCGCVCVCVFACSFVSARRSVFFCACCKCVMQPAAS